MKAPRWFLWLTEHVILPRWMGPVVLLLAAAANIVSGVRSESVFGYINLFVAGLCVAMAGFHFVLPGVFKMTTEVERDHLRKEVETSMQRAFEHFRDAQERGDEPPRYKQ
jgi:hypothetical protein